MCSIPVNIDRIPLCKTKKFKVTGRVNVSVPCVIRNAFMWHIFSTHACTVRGSHSNDKQLLFVFIITSPDCPAGYATDVLCPLPREAITYVSDDVILGSAKLLAVYSESGATFTWNNSSRKSFVTDVTETCGTGKQ